MKKPILFVTLGLQGSGKTFFSEKFAQDIGATRINSDELRLSIFQQPLYDFRENHIVFAAIDYFVEKLLQSGTSVMVDANFNKRKHRQLYEKLAKKYHAEYVTLWFQAPLDVAIARAEERDKGMQKPVTKDIVLRSQKGQEVPTEAEPHVAIDGQLPYNKQREIVLEHLRAL